MKTILFFCIALFIGGESEFYSFKMHTIDGKEFDFSALKGKKILIVNTASECGSTPQYADLQKLYEKYTGKLVIIGFPANNFGKQEPGTNEEISTFCTKNYKVTFQLMQKVSVNGDDMVPVFKWLTTQLNPDFTGDIKWNFEKFLIDENGVLVHRFRTKVNPMGEEIFAAIDGK
ncbi:MAG: glutathione peroxidase [Bacteroidia bacterium]|nr:glutathione peroxidase [Bacteroidia bacterium]